MNVVQSLVPHLLRANCWRVAFSVWFTNKKIRVWRKSRAPFWQAGYGKILKARAMSIYSQIAERI